MISRVMLTLFFLTATVFAGTTGDIENKNGGRSFLTIEDTLELKLEQSVSYFTKWLEDFNDKHLATTALGRMLHYGQIKAMFEANSINAADAQSGRSRKMAMAMVPLVFHLGATSVWMILTTILTFKSVAIGMTLLIIKIAASSAKLASFFTLLKSKHSEHHDWSWTPPHHEHYGHKRSFSDIEHEHPSADWQSYTPELAHHDTKNDHYPTYQTVPSSSYKRNDNLTPYGGYKKHHRDGKDKKYA